MQSLARSCCREWNREWLLSPSRPSHFENAYNTLVHLPATHVNMPLHTFVQVPQWSLSSSVLTHTPSQFDRPELHCSVQVPAWQVLLPPVTGSQALSQVPQWVLLVSGLTQALPQRT